jgi:hypothetical protein
MPKKISSGSISVKVTQYGDGRWCVYWNEDGKQRRLIRMTEKDAVIAAKTEIERMRAGIGQVGRQHLQDLAYVVPILERHNIGLRDLVKQWQQMICHLRRAEKRDCFHPLGIRPHSLCLTDGQGSEGKVLTSPAHGFRQFSLAPQ